VNGYRAVPVPLAPPPLTPARTPAGGPSPSAQGPRAELWLSPRAALPGPGQLAAIGLALGELFGLQGPSLPGPEELEWRFSGRWWLGPVGR
jgi:hypothetical protein